MPDTTYANPVMVCRKELIFLLLLFLLPLSTNSFFHPLSLSRHHNGKNRHILTTGKSTHKNDVVQPSQDNNNNDDDDVAVVVGEATTSSSSSSSSSLEEEEQPTICCYHSISRVDSRARALDVLVFRHGQLITSLEDHLMKNPTQTRDDALYYLTSTYDDEGQSLDMLGGELVQFYAHTESMDFIIDVWKNTTVEDRILLHSFLNRTHGVIGSIDAFTIHRPTNNNDDNTMGQGTTTLMIELKNLRVHDSFRRQGIGRSLVEAVQNYARKVKEEQEQGGAIVYLYYDSDNVGAIRLYKNAGFVVDEDDMNRMNWAVPRESK